MIFRACYSKWRIRKTKSKLRNTENIGINFNISNSFRYKIIEGSLKIGNNVYIDGTLITKGNGKIEIGNNCSFRKNTYIGSYNHIIIGNNVFGAPNIYITDNNNHPISPKLRYEMTQTPPDSPLWKWTNNVISSPVIIEDNVWIGQNSIILKGVKIGYGSIIGAGSVVTKDVPPFCIAAGNPAKVIKEIFNDINIDLSMKS